MIKLWALLLAVILGVRVGLPLGDAEKQEPFTGSFSLEKTYSSDLRFYALQTVKRIDSIRKIVVTVYDTSSDAPVFSFAPDRAWDHWGICWEQDSYDIWVQSGDIAPFCWEYLDGEWKRCYERVLPDYIVELWDSSYRDHPETWSSIYHTLTEPPAPFPAAEMARAAIRDDFCCVIRSGDMEQTFHGIHARAFFIQFFGAELKPEEDRTADRNSFSSADVISFEFLAGSPENGGTFPVGYYQLDSQDRIAFSLSPGEEPLIVCKTANSDLYDRLGYVLIVSAFAGSVSDALSQDQIVSLVQDHHDFLLQCITDNDPERAKEVAGIQSVSIEKNHYAAFDCGGHGLIPSSSYYGFYYSPKDIPLAVDVTRSENLVPQGDGFGWEEPDGDNRYYTERIMENWYYYESHY